ncbi:MAG: hypothetical protein ACO3YY_09360 [Phycisphaerales bacterium]|jgi:hypothetical protein
MHVSRLAIANTVVSAGLLGCSNPFASHYVGERWPATSTARVLEQAPSPDGVRWIGHSEFDSFDVLTDAEAITAARQVGADLVEWDDHSIGDRVKWSSSPVLWNQWDGKMFNQPEAMRQTEYRYEARFYRSDSLGGRIISGRRDVDESSEPDTRDENRPDEQRGEVPLHRPATDDVPSP